MCVMLKRVTPPVKSRPRPLEPRGRPATGRIVRLLIGLGQGGFCSGTNERSTFIGVTCAKCYRSAPLTVELY